MTQSATWKATLTEAELARWGEAVGKVVAPPVFLLLSGPLGAGKSVLARGIARGAGVRGAVPSPTFNLLLRYPTERGVEVVHLDLYRLDRPGELRELGWDELGEEDEIVLVEWPERAEGRLPADRWEVSLEPSAAASDLRDVRLARVGSPPELPPLPSPVT